jgi:hypothetical protein
MRENGLTLKKIADNLNESGTRSPGGKAFTPMTVRRVLARTGT